MSSCPNVTGVGAAGVVATGVDAAGETGAAGAAGEAGVAWGGVVDGSKGKTSVSPEVRRASPEHKSQRPKVSATPQSVPKRIQHSKRPRRLTLSRKGYFLQPRLEVAHGLQARSTW